MTKPQKHPHVERRDTIQAEQELFAGPEVFRVRILGINALGILHRHAADLITVLRTGGTVDVLLLDPQSAQFRKRRDAEEKRKGKVSNRLLTEMEASIAILRDVLNRMLHEYEYDIETLKDRFQIRLYDHRADKSLLFVETPESKKLLYRKVPFSPQPAGNPSESRLVSERNNRASTEYTQRLESFQKSWDAANVVPLEYLRDNILIVSPRKSDAPHIYKQAMEMHKKRRLDEASTLYKAVLRLEKPKQPTAEQIFLARRFLPRIFTTAREPFELKDLVVAVHPNKTERLLGYHLIWEDDIDYLTDNDPADHEIIWVKYSKDLKVENAWSYWHGKMLVTAKAVPDANAHNFRVKVYAQWGKHGLLLEGWEEKIGVDAKVPGYPDFATLEFSRLRKERYLAEGHYAERWPKRFEGELKEFIEFPVEIDLAGKLDKHNMIVVARYTNAVISQWYLPYNVYPKVDWPRRDIK
ncbi:MAG: hypothetical protein ACE5KF_10530 [Kiloniellaceae bacterium]